MIGWLYWTITFVGVGVGLVRWVAEILDGK